MTALISVIKWNTYKSAGWFRIRDVLLLRSLALSARRNGLSDRSKLMTALDLAARRLGRKLKRPVCMDRVIRSLSFMRLKYNAFTDFINSPGVVYVMKRNRVHIRPEYWRKLNGRNEGMTCHLLRVYGEPLYKELRTVFAVGRCVILSEELVAENALHGECAAIAPESTNCAGV